MRRLTISVDDDLADTFDQLVARKGYLNRSEAFRDLVRKALDEAELAPGRAQWCVATVSYVYDHHERQLSNRLTQIQHRHHNVALATLHVHLDHENCLETVVLKGRMGDVRATAEGMIAQTGVRHGSVHLVPVEIHDDGHHQPGHSHIHPHR